MPAIHGLIDRRILVNYHVDPTILKGLVPPTFEPLVVNGKGIAGVCLIRLKKVRPTFFPLPCGFESENAAYRISVTWDDAGTRREGVYVPRRDTSSLFNVWASGRVFPGDLRRARFQVSESDDTFNVDVNSRDGKAQIRYEGKTSEALPGSSVFGSLDEISAFFKRGSCGYNLSRNHSKYEGIELSVPDWQVWPLETTQISSNYFDDRDRFPEGSIEFDSALLMRNAEHEWRSVKTIPACAVA